MKRLHPVIMAGGSGTRLWPLSRKALPKQFHALVAKETMLEATLKRVGGEAYAPPVIIGSEIHRDALADALATYEGTQIVLEPMGRNTAPAAIVAALLAAETDPDSLVLLLPADHHITDTRAFGEAVQRGVAAAEQGFLVTLGITADQPETGYGYIRRGEKLTDGAFKVDAFVEKPNRPTAEQYITEGTYAWNAGIFLYRASDLLSEARVHAPDILAKTEAAFRASGRQGNIVSLPEAEFAAIPGESIDYAIMEKTERAAVVSPVTIGWNDVGSWSAVKDLAGSGTVGDVVAVGCETSLIRTSEDGPTVTAVGLENMIVVATKDAVLILPADQSQDVKKIIEKLKDSDRADLL